MNDDGEVDYSAYTYRELLEALNNINARKYPKNYRNLQIALEKIGPAQQAALEGKSVDVGQSLDDPPDNTPSENYETDPEVQHVKHLLTALIVAGLSAHLLWLGDIVLPFAEPFVVSLSGVGVHMGTASFWLAVSVPVSFAIDFLDSRDNAKKYRLYALFAEGAATALLFFAYLLSVKS